MPIIHLGTQADIGKPNFAYHLLNQDYEVYDAAIPMGQRPVKLGPNVYATYESHHGLCLEDFERNGYDDSDWYMVVWNPEKREPETILFASTRGWSYPCYGSKPDASEETLAAYAQYRDAESRLAFRRNREAKRIELCAIRDTAKAIAKAAGVPVGKVLKLRRNLGREGFEAVSGLFTKAIRSNFKLSLKAQVVSWLVDPAPKYATPLSKKQLGYI